MESPKTTKTRILFITRAYGEHGGGMERLSYEFINQLKQDPQVDARVIAHTGSRSTSPLHIIKGFFQAIKDARNSDVIHIGDPMLSATGWALKAIFKKPVAVTVHGLDLSWNFPPYQMYLKLFFSRLDLYLPISSYVKSVAEQHTDSKNIHVINPGVHDRLYAPNMPASELRTLLQKKDIQIPKDSKVLVTTGRLSKRKGHAWFIQHVLPNLPPNVVYLIAGSGPEDGNIRSLTEEIDHKVIMLGRVSNDELRIIYNTAHAFIQPNIRIPNDIEGFGLVLLEAALCELPVFVSDCEGMTDAIQEGKNGTLIETENPGAWITTLSKAINYLPRKATQSRQYTLETFSWDKQAGQYKNALSQVADAQQ